MSTPFKMKGNPMQRNFGAPMRDENDKKKVKTDSKGNTSASAKLDARDDIATVKHVDKDKAGGKGSSGADKKAVATAQRRSVIKGSYEKSGKELRKEANANDVSKGKSNLISKVKNRLTSKEKLRSETTANTLKDVKEKYVSGQSKSKLVDKEKNRDAMVNLRRLASKKTK